MSKTNRQREVRLCDTTAEGMLSENWEEGVERKLSRKHSAVCLDGEVWKVIDSREGVCGFVKPGNCVSSAELERIFEEILP